jgi:hypothetical protein
MRRQSDLANPCDDEFPPQNASGTGLLPTGRRLAGRESTRPRLARSNLWVITPSIREALSYLSEGRTGGLSFDQPRVPVFASSGVARLRYCLAERKLAREHQVYSSKPRIIDMKHQPLVLSIHESN